MEPGALQRPSRGEGEGRSLDWRYLLIALLPIMVFAATDAFLDTFGEASERLPDHFAPFDPHREASGRLSALGAVVLYTGVAIGALSYFVNSIRLLDTRSVMRVITSVGILVGAVAALIGLMNTRQIQDYMGPSVVCTALGYSPKISDDHFEEASRNSIQPKVRVTDFRTRGACDNHNFRLLRMILTWQKVATILGVAALVLGTICCLAKPVPMPVKDEHALAHYEAESERLNVYLYLSAMFLVTGLMLTWSSVRWPSYALLSSTGYEAHANAFVGYLGFSYTVLLASFYAPAAGILASRVRRLKPAAAGSTNLPEAFKGPTQVLKIVAAVFSTALAGTLPAILGLGT